MISVSLCPLNILISLFHCIYFWLCRLLAVMRKATEEITMDAILNKYKAPSTHTNSTMNVVNKTITMGKVEGSIQVG